MFEQVLFVFILLLALYGLSCLLTTVALKFTASHRKKPTYFLVYIDAEEPYQTTLLSIKQRLQNSGLWSFTQMVALCEKCNDDISAELNSFCNAEGIIFNNNVEKLSLSSLQKKKNDV